MSCRVIDYINIASNTTSNYILLYYYRIYYALLDMISFSCSIIDYSIVVYIYFHRPISELATIVVYILYVLYNYINYYIIYYISNPKNDIIY